MAVVEKLHRVNWRTFPVNISKGGCCIRALLCRSPISFWPLRIVRVDVQHLYNIHARLPRQLPSYSEPPFCPQTHKKKCTEKLTQPVLTAAWFGRTVSLKRKKKKKLSLSSWTDKQKVISDFLRWRWEPRSVFHQRNGGSVLMHQHFYLSWLPNCRAAMVHRKNRVCCTILPINYWVLKVMIHELYCSLLFHNTRMHSYLMGSLAAPTPVLCFSLLLLYQILVCGVWFVFRSVNFYSYICV